MYVFYQLPRHRDSVIVIENRPRYLNDLIKLLYNDTRTLKQQKKRLCEYGEGCRKGIKGGQRFPRLSVGRVYTQRLKHRENNLGMDIVGYYSEIRKM